MTTETQRPTPYDKKIAELRAKGIAQGGLDRFESELRMALGNKREGYLAAVADHAGLLAACEAMQAEYQASHGEGEAYQRLECWNRAMVPLIAAIAKAKGRSNHE